MAVKKTKKDEALKVLLERIERAEGYRDSNYRDKWLEYYKMYRSIPPEVEAGRSNVFVPYTFTNIETIAARITESLSANRPYVIVMPQEDGDADKAEKTQTLLDYQLEQIIRLKRIFSENIIKCLCIYGTAVSYTGWQVKERKVKKLQQGYEYLQSDETGEPLRFDDMNEPIVVEKLTVAEQIQTVYDDPIVQSIDIFDYFVDPKATCVSDARFCGHREYQTKEQLSELVKTAGYSIDWKTLAPADNIENGTTKRHLDIGISGSGEGDTERNNAALYEVLHYWEDNRHAVIINRCQLVLDSDNPFWYGEKPYDVCRYIPLANEFYGIGIPEINKALQSELNTTRNQRIDYNTMTMRRMWKLRKGSGLTSRDLIWRQGGVLEVNEMDDLQEINVQELPASAFANEANIKQDMRDATGCHDVVMGLSNNDETATTTITKDNNASIRFKAIIGSVEEDMLVPIAKKCIALDKQFLSSERAVRIVGEDKEVSDMMYIDPFEINGEYDIYYVGSAVEPMATKQANKQRYLEAFSIAAGLPEYAASPQAKINLLRELFKSLEIRDVEALLPDISAMQEQAAGATQQQKPQQIDRVGGLDLSRLVAGEGVV